MSKKQLPKFWTERDARQADKATTYEGLAKIACRILRRQWKNLPAGNDHIAIVSGTLTNGGRLPLRDIRANIRLFGKKIAKLERLGLPVWDQRPFEEHIFRIKNLPENRNRPMKLLDGFYKPVFDSGLITLAFMLPNWKQSHGARWEKRLFRKLGVSTFFTK
ncbi:MAG: hypothetical protein LiPW15_675 [Parcubacteria group bacterium LiPW_15]|nr:MAG: hypothetical protein LiPW15_675 [Parcubacteria group bacterium LiPW_15]